MPEIKNNFIQGKMNKDLDDRILPNGQYRDANNITVSKSENSDVGTVQNIKGNEYAGYDVSLGLGEIGFATYTSAAGLISIFGNHTGSGANQLTPVIKPNMFVRGLRNSSTIGQGNVEIKYETRRVTAVNLLGSGHTTVNVTPTGFNSVGNTAANGTAQAGDRVFFSFNTKVIGYYADSITGDVFYFVTNFTPTNVNDDSSLKPNTQNSIRFADNTHICRVYYKNINNSEAPKAIIDSHRLNFSTLHKINNINRIDDLLFWTDNYNQPRRINWKLASTTETNPYTDDIYLEDKISVAQYAPYTSPKVTMSYDATIKSKHIEEEFVKFAYRFKYDNNEYSLISPFTQHCFHPGKPTQPFNDGTFDTSGTNNINSMAGIMTNEDMENAVKESDVENMVNKANKIVLDIDLPFDDTIANHASAAVNNGSGLSGSTNHAIDTVSGTIAANNIVLTANDDLYTVTGSITSTDFDTTTAISPNIADNTNLYFFNISAAPQFSWENKLNIKEIEILYSESDSTAIKVVDTIKITNSNFSVKPTIEVISSTVARLRYKHQYTYKSTKPLKTLPEADIIRVSDVIPIKAKTQEVSGNRIIYGNFLQNRSIDGVLNTSKMEVSNSEQAEQNKQYLLSSIKSGRTYSVGIVLSDRYGRQSPVILPSNSTTFSERKAHNDVVTNGSNSWKHNCLRLSFSETINDEYNNDISSANYNPLGWYSYRIVIKQTEQDYYNVYTPQVIRASQALFPEKTYVYLNGDNINKVPRDVNESSTETGIAGSSARLLPVIIDEDVNKAAADRFDGLSVNRFPEFINVGSIGTAREFNLTNDIDGDSSDDVLEEIFKSKNNPLLAELPQKYPSSSTPSNTSGTGIGAVYTNFKSAVASTPSRPGFSFNVFETFPFISSIDIYYETSSCGLVVDLNDQIDNSSGDVPVSQTLSANTVAESATSGTTVGALTTTNGNGVTMNSANNNSVEHDIDAIVDGNSVDRTGTFTIVGQNIVTASTFDFKSNSSDNYTITLITTKVGTSDSKTFSHTINITNVAPSINVGPIGQANNTNNTTGRTITSVTAGQSTGLQMTGINGGLADATRALSFSIVSQTNAGRYTINSSTGIISAGVNLSNGMDDTLTLKVTDLNGSGLDSPNTTLRILASGVVVVPFYRSANGQQSQSQAGDNETGVLAYFRRTGSPSGTQATPDEGDTVFSDSSATTPFSTGSAADGTGGLFHSMNGPGFASAGNALFTFKTSSNGVVTDKQLA